MDTQATETTAPTPFSLDLQEGKLLSENVFCDDLPEGESLFGEIFPDEGAMKAHYLRTARRMWPETSRRKGENTLLRHLVSRLKKRRLMLYLLCRDWPRQYWQLQTECLGLITENGLPLRQKRGLARVLHQHLCLSCEMSGMRDFIREELALCSRQIQDVREVLKRMEGKGGKGEPEAVEAKNAEDFPTGTRENAPVSESVETLAVSGKGEESPVSEQEDVLAVSEHGKEEVPPVLASGKVSAPEHAGDPSEGSEG